MRLLIIGSTAPDSLENAYHRAFAEQADVTVERFDSRTYRGRPISAINPRRLLFNRYTYPIHAGVVQHALRRFFRTSEARYTAVLVFKGMELSAETIIACRAAQPGAVWVNINPDDPFNTDSVGSTNADVLASLPLYDVYCIWSRALVRPLQARGCRRVEYLPFGYDSWHHTPPKRLAEPSITRAVFIGRWDREREATLAALAGTDLKIFGPAWDRVSLRSPLQAHIVRRPLFGEELARESASAAVSLNLLRPQNLGAHNMRTFEIPAVGGLMLTTRSEEQEAFFPEGEASFMYDGSTELRTAIATITANPDIARRVRARGKALVQQHSYLQRARTVRSFIEGVRNERG